MHVIFCKYRKKLYTGNLPRCLEWASEISTKKNVVIPIFITRPESNEARMLYEVSKSGIRLIKSRQYAKLLKGAVWEDL